MSYFCCNEKRREVLRGSATLNGIDHLEVQDDPSLPADQRGRTLLLHFVNPVTCPLATTNVLITGGERIRDVTVTGVNGTTDDKVLKIELDKSGDFSIYTLRLVLDSDYTQKPPNGYDGPLSAVDFSFKFEYPNDCDGATPTVCPPEVHPELDIDYLAKDYASFRRVMLDRMALLIPQWKEPNPADAGIALLELLSYVGDYLSYRQDSIATEAYIGTARRRVSVRRHARLAGYTMHDGCNARAWVQICVNKQVTIAYDHTEPIQFLTHVLGRDDTPAISPGSPEYNQAILQGAEVFELMPPDLTYKINLRPEHNTISFYTWGDRECYLPAGATEATLLRSLPHLQSGDVLIFVDQAKGNAGPSHRHAVRLTSVEPDTDPLGGLFTNPPTNKVTRIKWDPVDALPFALCISSSAGGLHGIALGNIVLADHGLTLKQSLGAVPRPVLTCLESGEDNRCNPTLSGSVPPRFRPRLLKGPLTQVGRAVHVQSNSGTPRAATRRQLLPFDPAAPAAAAFQWDITRATPAISVTDNLRNTWNPQHDLLGSRGDARDFVAEMEEDGLATLRFGDDVHGMRPKPVTDPQQRAEWRARFRVGNGTRGNVGLETIKHISSGYPELNDVVTAVSNPLPARGGIDPEQIEDVRQHALVAFRRQERAVTLADYAEVAQRHPGVLRAVATYRWNGSWRTVFLMLERRGRLPVDNNFKDEIRLFMERYRIAGQDLEIDGPRYVSLEIELQVSLKTGFFWSQVKEALLTVFSNRFLPNGEPGVFYPDNFTFGQAVYLSPLYAAARKVPGVAYVTITKFQRWGSSSTAALEAGVMSMNRREIARLDNDPNFPEHGVFRVNQFS